MSAPLPPRPDRQSLVLYLALLMAGACIGPDPMVTVGPLPGPTPCTGAVTMTDSSHQIRPDTRAFLLANGYCNFFIPEYHDEQRLTDGDDDYGPIAYAFAYQTAGAYPSHTNFDNGWINAAVIDIHDGNLYPPYHALKLRRGLNCLFLTHVHDGQSDRWRAAMAPPVNGSCSSVDRADLLPMVAEQPSQDPNDYPIAARFEEGPGRKPYIGVKCANYWCIVGTANGSGLIPPAFAGLPGQGTSSRWRIKGWFDDQTLGAPAAEGHFGIQPRLKLAIVPVDNLGTLTIADFANTGSPDPWVHVATVIVPPHLALPPKYGMRGLGGYGMAAGVNRLYLRAVPTGPNSYDWFARVHNPANPAGEYIYPTKVVRVDHSSTGIPVPPTARWRWVDSDEEVWVRCDAGCCRIQPS